MTDVAMLGWVTGFYEGEGSCCITHLRGYPLIRVSISQVDPTPLQRIKEVFGGQIQHKVNRKTSFGSRPINIWSLCSRKAREFLKLIRPYMKSDYKIGQVEGVLKRDAEYVNPDYCKKGVRNPNGTFKRPEKRYIRATC